MLGLNMNFSKRGCLSEELCALLVESALPHIQKLHKYLTVSVSVGMLTETESSSLQYSKWVKMSFEEAAQSVYWLLLICYLCTQFCSLSLRLPRASSWKRLRTAGVFFQCFDYIEKALFLGISMIQKLPGEINTPFVLSFLSKESLRCNILSNESRSKQVCVNIFWRLNLKEVWQSLYSASANYHFLRKMEEIYERSRHC